MNLQLKDPERCPNCGTHDKAVMLFSELPAAHAPLMCRRKLLHVLKAFLVLSV